MCPSNSALLWHSKPNEARRLPEVELETPNSYGSSLRMPETCSLPKVTAQNLQAVEQHRAGHLGADDEPWQGSAGAPSEHGNGCVLARRSAWPE